MHTTLAKRRILNRAISSAFALLALPATHAADLTWDITPGIVGAGDGAISGGTGTWDLTNGNWTTNGGGSNVAWTNNPLDSAIFQGTAGTVTLGATLTVEDITFNTGTYTINGTDGSTAVNRIVLASTDSTFNTVGNVNFTGRIEGATLTKTGAGTLTFNNGFTNLQNLILNGGVTVFNMGFDNQDALDVGGTLTVNAGATARLGINPTGGTTGVNNFKVSNQFVINGGTVDVQERTDVGRITMTGGTIIGQTPTGNDSLGRLWIREQGFVINASATSSVISTNNLALAANTTFDVADGAAASDLIVNSRIMQAFGITKAGAGTMVLNGANSYTGATLLNAGTLALGATGSLSTTAITVAPGATFRAAAGSFAGSTAAGTLGATLSLGATSIFDMADGTVGTFNLGQNASFAANALALDTATLRFDLNNAGADKLNVTKAGTFLNTNVIDVVPSGGFLINGAYDVITTASLTNLGGSFTFPGGLTSKIVTLGSTNYTLGLVTTATGQQVTVSGGFDPLTTAYWKGGSGVWNATSPSNWATNAAGAAAGIYPTSGSDVIFSVTGGGSTLNTTLGQNLAINSLTFSAAADAAHAVTIGGANSLTIGAGGLTVQANSGAHTISNTGVVLGSAQTWSNFSSSPLKVTAAVSGSNLSLAGTGTFILTGANTYGSTDIGSGTVLRVGDGTVGGTLGTGTVNNLGQLVFNRSDNYTVAPQLNGTGQVVKSGTGIMTYTGGSGTLDLVVEQGRLLLATGFDQRDALAANGVMTVKAGAVAQLGDGTTTTGVNNFSFDREWNILEGGTVDVRDRTDIGKITMTGGSLIGTAGIGNSGKLFIRTPGFQINASTVTSVSSTGLLALANDGGPQFVPPPVFNVADGAAEPDFLVNSAIRENSAGLGFIKTGAGKMTLASTQNSLTGTTTISEGTVEVAAGSALGGTENVAAAGTLSGAGTVGIVNLSGKISPGILGIGKLTTGTLTFSDGAVLAVDFSGATSDSADVNGTATLSGTSKLELHLTSDPTDGTVFTLLNSTGGVFGYDVGGRFSYLGNALLDDQQFTVVDGAFSQAFTIQYDADGGKDVTLTAVPEPASAALLLGGLGLLARRRRRAC